MEGVKAIENTDHVPIRVMLVDDSSIVRGMISRSLKDQSEIAVVASASDGEMALNVLRQHPVDVIVLDIEMPKMDGLTALPKLLELSPHSKIIMASTLTVRNAKISMEALQMGASDYVPKPSSRENVQAVEEFYRELREKILALGHAAQRKMNVPRRPVTTEEKPRISTVAADAPHAAKSVGITALMAPLPVRAIAIASSTGGPQALLKVLKLAGAALDRYPVFVTQHMPAKFTTLLADHLSKDTGRKCLEAQQGMMAEAGVVYIAPGDYHMVPRQQGEGGAVQITLNQDAPVNFCRPAADPMIKALVPIFRQHLLLVVLTGMGSDGLGGAHEVVKEGGTVVAQDEETSVVWGMPGSVSNAQLCKAVMPLNEIPSYLQRVARM